MPEPKDKDWMNEYKNKTPIYVVYKRPNSKQGTHTVKGWKKIAHRQIANSKFIDSYADILYQLSHQGSPNSSVGKESACNAGDPRLIPGSGISPGEGIGYPLQYSGLQNAMDLYSPWGHEESGTNDPLSLSHVDIIKK